MVERIGKEEGKILAKDEFQRAGRTEIRQDFTGE
jgi:hypothetical protein